MKGKKRAHARVYNVKKSHTHGTVRHSSARSSRRKLLRNWVIRVYAITCVTCRYVGFGVRVHNMNWFLSRASACELVRTYTYTIWVVYRFLSSTTCGKRKLFYIHQRFVVVFRRCLHR